MTRMKWRWARASAKTAIVLAAYLGVTAANGDYGCLPGSYQGWFVQMPAAGPGYYFYLNDGRWGVRDMVYGLMDAGCDFDELLVGPQGWGRIGIGHISKETGGYFSPHQSHRCGVDADMLLLTANGAEQGVVVGGANYSRDRTFLYIVYYLSAHLNMSHIFLNDPALYGPLIQYSPGHEDHMHVRIYRPSGFTESICPSYG
ncbi:MAG: penicillin-insensitive murein endopeptidase [Myxococcales bacterium]|nr:penicillin-insensitive murein endopeptidase [Myxococcales bacterium]